MVRADAHMRGTQGDEMGGNITCCSQIWRRQTSGKRKVWRRQTNGKRNVWGDKGARLLENVMFGRQGRQTIGKREENAKKTCV